MDKKIKIAMIDALPNDDSTNNKLFVNDSPIFNELSNDARSFISHLLENHTKLKANSGALFDEAKNKISADIANKVSERIQKNKAMLTSFINKKSRSTPADSGIVVI